MNTSIILLALFCAIGGYLIGLNRGNGFNKSDYEEGYEDGWSDCVDTINANLDELEVKSSKKEELDGTREQKARELIEQLDELFDPECPVPEEVFPDPPKDDDDILDGGTY